MSNKNVEEQKDICLQYDNKGLLPAIVQEQTTGEILMLAYINEEAYLETITSGYATFWSRSRKEIWKKGETSGNRMKIIELLVDCDQDCVIFKVEKTKGGACHTNNRKGNYRNTCFYRRVDVKNNNLLFLEE